MTKLELIKRAIESYDRAVKSLKIAYFEMLEEIPVNDAGEVDSKCLLALNESYERSQNNLKDILAEKLASIIQ